MSPMSNKLADGVGEALAAAGLVGLIGGMYYYFNQQEKKRVRDGLERIKGGDEGASSTEDSCRQLAQYVLISFALQRAHAHASVYVKIVPECISLSFSFAQVT